MLRACVGHQRATKSPVLTVSDRMCLKACKESTSTLQKCSKKNKEQHVHQLGQLVNLYQPQLSALQDAGSAAEVCSENLRAALTQIAEARRVFQNNSIMSFVPLGLQQMLQVLQGHEVESLVMDTCGVDAVCHPLAVALQDFLQGVMHLIKQKKEANDAQLKRSMAELTSDFRAKLAEHSTRAEAEKGEITRRFEAEAAGTAESSAQDAELMKHGTAQPSQLQNAAFRLSDQLSRRCQEETTCIAVHKAKTAEFAQMSQGRQQLQSQMHALQERHGALSKELAAEKLQRAVIEQELSAVQQDKLHLGDQLKEFAQVNQERQQLEAQMDAVILREIDLNKRKHALQKSHDALTTELAAEKLQHGDTKEQLSVVQQDNSQYVDELKSVQADAAGLKAALSQEQHTNRDLQERKQSTTPHCTELAHCDEAVSTLEASLLHHNELALCNENIQAETAGLKAALSHEQLINTSLQERVNILEASLLHDNEPTLFNEDPEQEAADLQQSQVYANPAYEEVEVEQNLLEARLKAAEDTTAVLQTELQQALQGSRSLQEEVDALQCELSDNRQGRSAADDQQDQLEAALPKPCYVSVGTQVDSELRAEESKSEAVSDATHTDSVDVGTNTLQCWVDFTKLKETAAALETERNALTQNCKHLVQQCKNDKDVFQERLGRSQEETRAAAAQSETLTTELADKQQALSQWQTRSNDLQIEYVSYRAQCHEQERTIAFQTTLADRTNARAYHMQQHIQYQGNTIHELQSRLYWAMNRTTQPFAVPRSQDRAAAEPRPSEEFSFCGLKEKTVDTMPAFLAKHQTNAKGSSNSSPTAEVGAGTSIYHNKAIRPFTPQASRHAASVHGDRAAVRPCSPEGIVTRDHMAIEHDDAAVEGSSAAEGLGAMFLAKLQQKDMSNSSPPAETGTMSAAYPDDAILPFAGPSLSPQGSRCDVTAQPTWAAQGYSRPQKATSAGVAMQDAAGVVGGGSAAAEDSSAAEGTAEAKGFGPGFLGKLHTQDMSNSSPPSEAGTMSAMHQDECVHPSTAPSPPLQASRPGMTAEPTLATQGASPAQIATNVGMAMQDAAVVVGGGSAAAKSYSAAVTGYSAAGEGYSTAVEGDSAAAAAALQAQLVTAPPLPMRALYFTPLSPQTLDAMSADERQSYWDTVSRVSLTHDTASRHDSTSSAGLRGAYVTPMPPPSPRTTTSSSSQVAAAEQPSACEGEERGNRLGDDAACDVMHQAAQLQGGITSEGEDADASQQGSESLQATSVQQPRKKRRSNNRARRRKYNNRRRKASQQAAIADDDDEHGALDAAQHS